MVYLQNQQRAALGRLNNSLTQHPAPSEMLTTTLCDLLSWSTLHGYLQAYLWCAGPDVPKTLPAQLAKPWASVSAALHMPPVLVYATYNLMNWRRLDEIGPLELGNLAVQQVIWESKE
jgi:hypothetical protein